MSICVVSADPNVFQLVREGLDAASTALALEVFSNGADAVTRLYNPDAIKPKIVFVDASTMPDAARFIDFVRASGPTRTVPVIAMTDSPASSAVTFVEVIRATHVLRKPVAAREITRIIDTLQLANFENKSVSTATPSPSSVAP